MDLRHHSDRVLILAPTGNDGAVQKEVLTNEQISVLICEDMQQLCSRIEDGTGTAIIAEEALSGEALALLAKTIDNQPEWSDFPMIIMASAGSDPDMTWVVLSGEKTLNAAVLKRPVLTKSLLTAVRASLRSRRQQYRIADELSKRKEAEKEVRESETRLRLALDAARMVAWEYDITTLKVTRSENAEKVLQLPKKHENSDEGYLLIHPDDVEKHRTLVNKAIAGGGSYVSAYRHIHDEHIVWLEEHGQAIVDQSGKTIRLVGVIQNINERKQAEDLLRRSEERWTLAIENIAEGIIIATEDEQVIYWNPAAQRMHGFTRPEEGIEPLEETPVIFDLLSPDSDHLLTFDEWPMRRIKRGESVRNLELRLRRPDQGWEKYVSYSGAMVQTAEGEKLIFLSVHDLTEQYKSQKALRYSETKFRAIFEQAAVGIGRVSFASTRWIDVNAAFCDMLGYSAEEFKATPWPQITHPEDIDLDLIPFTQMSAGELDSYSVEKRFIHKDGHYVWARLTLSLVRDEQGNPDYEIAIIEDISDRKSAEEKLRRYAKELESANKDLESFSYSVAHDLRNPLRIIKGFINFLSEDCRDNLNDECRDYVNRIDSGADRMGSIIDDILALSKISRQETSISDVNLSEMAKAAVEELRSSQPGHQPESTFRKDCGLKRMQDS